MVERGKMDTKYDCFNNISAILWYLASSIDGETGVFV